MADITFPEHSKFVILTIPNTDRPPTDGSVSDQLNVLIEVETGNTWWKEWVADEYDPGKMVPKWKKFERE